MIKRKANIQKIGQFQSCYWCLGEQLTGVVSGSLTSPLTPGERREKCRGIFPPLRKERIRDRRVGNGEVGVEGRHCKERGVPMAKSSCDVLKACFVLS